MRTQSTLEPTGPDRRYYWWYVLPIQSALLTAYIMPLYGFNSLIKPFNELFSPADPLTGWPGALAGGAMFLGAGFGGLLGLVLNRCCPDPRWKWLLTNVLLVLCIVLGAVAGWSQSYLLVLLGFALPGGICTGFCFAQSLAFLITWARHMRCTGLQSGVFGLMFGVWGAIFSLLAPMVVQRWGVEWTLLATGAVLLAAAVVSSLTQRQAPLQEQPDEPQRPSLTRRQLLSVRTFWVFLLFFLIFLAPGFGFKVIVQSLSQQVYHVSDLEASLIAATFLLSYGVSRLFCGIIADHVRLKPMYLFFTIGQVTLLLVAAIGLPHVQGITFLVIVMCLIGGLFAAGKSLWGMMMISIFGPSSFHTTITTVLPAFGLAGLLGPLSLNWALRSDDVVTTTTWWFYGMAAAMGIALVLCWMLRRLDFDALDEGRRQALHLHPGAHSELDRF